MTWIFGALLAAAMLGRNALDVWLSPTQDFYARSVVSTWIAVSLFTLAGAHAAWRSRTIASGVRSAALAGLIAAVANMIVSAGELAAWHDPHTMAMIRASGGVGEIFVLPVFVVIPGTCCAFVGALAAKFAIVLVDHTRPSTRASASS